MDRLEDGHTHAHAHTHTHTHAHTGRFKGSIHKVRGVDVLFLSTQRRQPLLYRPSRETAPKCNLRIVSIYTGDLLLTGKRNGK